MIRLRLVLLAALVPSVVLAAPICDTLPTTYPINQSNPAVFAVRASGGDLTIAAGDTMTFNVANGSSFTGGSAFGAPTGTLTVTVNGSAAAASALVGFTVGNSVTIVGGPSGT